MRDNGTWHDELMSETQQNPEFKAEYDSFTQELAMLDEKQDNKIIMSQIKAKVIKDSTYNGTRIITIEAEYPTMLQAQLNTHRMVVRNCSSSRAIPTRNFIETPFIPTKVGRNCAGMSAKEYLDGAELEAFQEDWLKLYQNINEQVLELQAKYNIHKQTLNRVLSSGFSTTKGVFTATLDSWLHVLMLRLHGDAQPEIQELAERIKEAIEASTPQVLQYGEFHLPYVDSVENGDDNINIKLSISQIAQVSYRKLDDTIEKALKIFQQLHLLDHTPENPPHWSPCQHVMQALGIDDTSDWLFDKFYNAGKKYYAEMGDSFVQIAKFIENDKSLTIDLLEDF